MFTDYWVIAQLLAQGCAFILLLYASIFGIKSLRYWAADSDTALQLGLERQTYLMSAIMQVGLWFQVLSLFMFLHTVNDHLPPLVKGAMCATGTLGINDWGYPLLGLKCIGILIYATYLFINYLDAQEPAYPLTPYKYFWLYPALIVCMLDFYMLIQYFAAIKPDLIATCCSVDFTATARSPYELNQQGFYWWIAVSVWVISFVFLYGMVWLRLFDKSLIATLVGFVVSIVYSIASVYTLKYFFVKYMYGLPSHLCLFDIFWAKYYGIGYILFGSYYAVVLGILGYVVKQVNAPKLTGVPSAFAHNLRWVVLAGLSISFFLPLLYWKLSGYVF